MVHDSRATKISFGHINTQSKFVIPWIHWRPLFQEPGSRWIKNTKSMIANDDHIFDGFPKYRTKRIGIMGMTVFPKGNEAAPNHHLR